MSKEAKGGIIWIFLILLSTRIHFVQHYESYIIDLLIIIDRPSEFK